MRFWVGGYSADMGGNADGIGVLHAGAASTESPRGSLAFAGTVTRAESPSWLAAHPTLDIVYAALEQRGVVQAYRRTGIETLAPLGAAVSTGAGTCHLALSPAGDLVMAASYGDGTVTRVSVGADGSLQQTWVLDAAHDPYATTEAEPYLLDARTSAERTAVAELAAASRALREAAGGEFAHLIPEYTDPDESDAVTAPVSGTDARSSRAHHVTFMSDGLVATTDLGCDLVRIWRGTQERQRIALPKGTGPRHGVWHPSGHLYVVTEYSAEVYALAPTRAGEWRVIAATPVSRETQQGRDFSGHISTTNDGEFLHVTVRGSNTVATIAVRDGGARLDPVALVETETDWPRHHLVVGDAMVIVGQRSDDIVTRAVSMRTGVVGQLLHRTLAPTPTVVLPLHE